MLLSSRFVLKGAPLGTHTPARLRASLRRPPTDGSESRASQLLAGSSRHVRHDRVEQGSAHRGDADASAFVLFNEPILDEALDAVGIDLAPAELLEARRIDPLAEPQAHQ